GQKRFWSPAHLPACAARKAFPCIFIYRKIHIEKAHFSRVDIVFFQLRECLQKKLVTVRTLKICEFDDCHRRILRTQQGIIPNIDLYCGGSNLCLCVAGRTLSESTTVDQAVNEDSQFPQFGQYFVSLLATHQILSVCGRNQYRCYSNEPGETAPHGQSSFPPYVFPDPRTLKCFRLSGFFLQENCCRLNSSDESVCSSIVMPMKSFAGPGEKLNLAVGYLRLTAPGTEVRI